MSEEGVPEGRCGFVLEPGDVGGEFAEEYVAKSEEWHEYCEVVCCWRNSWDRTDTSRCIWHAEMDEKTADLLVKARAEDPERLDGAHLRETELGDDISLKDCRMWGADLGGTDFRRADLGGAALVGADLGDADFRWAHIVGGDLKHADLSGANFLRADLSGVDLLQANLVGANLADTDLQQADLRRADLCRANLLGANLNGADLGEADLSGANLRAADLTGTDLVEADLSSADLEGAGMGGSNLQGANLYGSNLVGAYLEGADFEWADLRGADLTGADLSGRDFRGMNFIGTNLADADLTDANLRNADLKAATLEDAVLTRTDLRGADLEYAELYQTLFSDIRMNNRTEFGETCQYEARDIEPQIGGDDSDVTPLEAAAWTYRRIQTLHEENALAQDAREYHVKKAEAYRKLRWREFADVWSRPHRDPWNWLTTFVRATTYSANRWLSRHGESPHRVVGVSLLVIFASAVLYPLVGGIKQPPTPDGTPTVIAFDLLPSIPIPLPGPIADLATSLYFSVVTFTTLGYGDLQPASGAAQALATVESFTGALLMALLVFVLGRRATW